MDEKNKKKLSRSQILDMNIRLDPEQRLCPEFDSTSIKLFEVQPPDTDPCRMGFRVLDNCAEEHAMS